MLSKLIGQAEQLKYALAASETGSPALSTAHGLWNHPVFRGLQSSGHLGILDFHSTTAVFTDSADQSLGKDSLEA